jgi:hypothetical protein
MENRGKSHHGIVKLVKLVAHSIGNKYRFIIEAIDVLIDTSLVGNLLNLSVFVISRQAREDIRYFRRYINERATDSRKGGRGRKGRGAREKGGMDLTTGLTL